MHCFSVVVELQLYRYHLVQLQGAEELIFIVVRLLLCPEVRLRLFLNIRLDELRGLIGRLYLQIAEFVFSNIFA